MEGRGIRRWIKAVFIALVMFLVFIPSVKAHAAEHSGTCGDNLTWTLSDDGTVLPISGSGSMTDYSYDAYNDRIIPPWSTSSDFAGNSKITKVILSDEITNIGKNAFYKCSGMTSISIPNSATSIGYQAFYECDSLGNINIPDSVTSIGGGAFYGCSSLVSANIPDSVTSIGNYAFYGCTSLVSANIPDSETSIGDRTFSGCSSLTSITIPERVTNIGIEAFADCSSLTSIIIPNPLPYVSPEYSFHEDVIIQSSAFSGCTSLTKVGIPVACYITTGVFRNCPIADVYYEGTREQWSAMEIREENESLTGATIHYESYDVYPPRVTSVTVNPVAVTMGIGTSEKLTAIIHPEDAVDKTIIWSSDNTDIVTVDENGCITGKGLGSTTVHARSKHTNYESYCSVTVIEGSRWGTCGINLSWWLSDDETVLTISGSGNSGGLLMYGYDFDDNPDTYYYRGQYQSSVVPPWSEEQNKAGNSKITQVILPEGLQNIGSWAFAGCSNLASITIPDSVGSIGEGAFKGCSSLTSITIPDSETNINDLVFRDCSSLTSIRIPDSVRRIGLDAFYNCSSLTSISIPNSVTSIDSSAFASCSSLTSISIPNSVTSIGSSAFASCSSLTSISIPNSVTSIDYSAFNECSSLTSISIPSSVTSIDSWTFLGCSSLTSVTIPNSVTEIRKGAFSGCPIADVYYEGTKDQWDAIRMEEYYQVPRNATIHYGVTPVDAEQVVAFVSRMYTVALGREAEEAGLNDWSSQLMNRTKDGAGIAQGFIESKEFIARNLSNEQYLDVLYHTFFDRDADEGGYNSWLTQLNGGASRRHVLAGFVNSDEFTALCSRFGITRGTLADDNQASNAQVQAFVERMYVKALGREAEAEGVASWTQRITSGEWQAANVAKEGFFTSQEYINRNRTNEEFVEDLYKALFDRSSDEAGRADWLSRLANGASREDVMNGFGGSQEFANMLAGFGL